MDPLTATMNALTAYINWSSARFAAAPPDQQAALATIDAQLIREMWNVAVKIHDDLAAVAAKVKGVLAHVG